MNSRHFSHFFAALAIFLGVLQVSHAGPVQSRVQAGGSVKICIWPDYFGITYRHPHTGVLSGLDIDLSAELARDLGVKPVYVDSSFQTLVADLLGDRCDVAMFAVGKLKQRMEVLRFTRAYMASDIYGITVKGSRIVHEWADIDKPGVLVAVQAGTFMEAVMGERLKQARMVMIKPPATRERDLQAGRVDVFMTDYPYSHGLIENSGWASRIAPPQPFFVLPYAYAVKPGDDEWLKEVDQFVERIMKDGRLDAAGRRSGLTPLIAH